MSRSPYYPRRRSRLQQAIAKSAFENDGENRPQRIRPCVVCNADLPVVSSDGLFYLQAPLECMGNEVQKALCPWRVYLEDGAAKERDATPASDSVWGPVHRSSVGGEELV